MNRIFEDYGSGVIAIVGAIAIIGLLAALFVINGAGYSFIQTILFAW